MVEQAAHIRSVKGSSPFATITNRSHTDYKSIGCRLNAEADAVCGRDREWVARRGSSPDSLLRQLLDFPDKLLNIFEVPIDRCKPDIGDPVDIVQPFENQFTDPG